MYGTILSCTIINYCFIVRMAFVEKLKAVLFYKNYMKIISFILVVFLVCGCRKEQIHEGKVIYFDLGQEAENIHSASLIKDCKIIPLETG